MPEAQPMINFMLTLDDEELKDYKDKVERWETKTETYRIARVNLLEAINERVKN